LNTGRYLESSTTAVVFFTCFGRLDGGTVYQFNVISLESTQFTGTRFMLF